MADRAARREAPRSQNEENEMPPANLKGSRHPVGVPVRTAASADEVEIASEDRYQKLIYHMPTPLLQIDTRRVRVMFERLRAEGVTDIATFLDANPELVELTKDIVQVTEVNRAAVSLFRAQSALELIRPVRYFFTVVPDMIQRIMIAHFEGRRNFSEQTRIATFDGQIRDVLFSVTYPAPPEQLGTTFVTMLDITERLHTEAQLSQRQTDRAHAARISTLGELVTSIAHEVKQPLAAIITNAEANLHWLARGDVNVYKIKQLTSRIISSANRASDIVQRIQNLAVRGEPERTILDLNEVTEEALLFVRHDLETAQICLSIDALPSLPKVFGDRVQLQQVIVNLLMNSIQAISQARHPPRHIRVSIRSAEAGPLIFAVRDSGPGIANGDLNRIFDSFFTTKKNGMGIGLAICQSIINAHGGHISASNIPDGGACFQFVLPIMSPS